LPLLFARVKIFSKEKEAIVETKTIKKGAKA